MVITVLVYGGIFLLLLLNSLIRVRRAKPLELIKTASMGERMPKFLWVEALVGIALLPALPGKIRRARRFDNMVCKILKKSRGIFGEIAKNLSVSYQKLAIYRIMM